MHFFRKTLLTTLVIGMMSGCVFLPIQSSLCAKEYFAEKFEQNSDINEDSTDLTKNLDTDMAMQDLNTESIVANCRNPNKNCENKQLADSSFAKSTSTIYVDVCVGYAALSTADPNVIAEPLTAILSSLVNTNINRGGAGYRFYGGFLADISDRISLGFEAGFTYYPSTKGLIKVGGSSIDFTALNDYFDTDTFTSTDVPSFIGRMHQRGFGADLLSNLTIYCTPNFYVSFKPGIQFGYQSNKLSWEIGSNSVTDIVSSKNKYSKTALLPEVILACGWDFFVNTYQINLEFNYQHVFGRDSAIMTNIINSRDMIALSFGFSY